jgi:hypothetical protein
MIKENGLLARKIDVFKHEFSTVKISIMLTVFLKNKKNEVKVPSNRRLTTSLLQIFLH